MRVYLIGLAAALAAMAGWSAWMQGVGVRKEQVRVEAIGKKTDARAKVARKKAEEKPHDSLRAWCRDC
jgi:hypothetical protein